MGSVPNCQLSSELNLLNLAEMGAGVERDNTNHAAGTALTQ